MSDSDILLRARASARSAASITRSALMPVRQRKSPGSHRR